jgi:hypothetical protein
LKLADTVTGLFGIVNVQGSLEGPPEQDAPDVVQLENCQLADGFAATEIDEPTASEHPLGQLGETDPEPEAFVVNGWMTCTVCVKVAPNVTAPLGIENVQGLVEHEIPV